MDLRTDLRNRATRRGEEREERGEAGGELARELFGLPPLGVLPVVPTMAMCVLLCHQQNNK